MHYGNSTSAQLPSSKHAASNLTRVVRHALIVPQVVDTGNNALRYIPADAIPAPSFNTSTTCATLLIATLQSTQGSYTGLANGFTSTVRGIEATTAPGQGVVDSTGRLCP